MERNLFHSHNIEVSIVFKSPSFVITRESKITARWVNETQILIALPCLFLLF